MVSVVFFRKKKPMFTQVEFAVIHHSHTRDSKTSRPLRGNSSYRSHGIMRYSRCSGVLHVASVIADAKAVVRYSEELVTYQPIAIFDSMTVRDRSKSEPVSCI